jgi:hypothetical protein
MVNPFRRFLRAFDHWLCQREGVLAFTQEPEVVLRVQDAVTPVDILLPDGSIPSGSRILKMHIWSDRMPEIPAQGPDLAWALRLRRLIESSSRAVARYIQMTSHLQEIRAIGGITAHVSLQGANGGRSMLEHLGFLVFPYHRPLGAFGEFWENLFTYWLLWAYNPNSLRHHKLLDMQRTEVWMSRENFLQRFGGGSQ